MNSLRPDNCRSPDQAPIDVAAMSVEEFDQYILDTSPKLASFPLHTHEWRLAFLRELYMQGYPALLEGVSHAWALMERPKAARCTYVGLLAGTGGKGKKALYNFFRQMIADALDTMHRIPPIDDFPSLARWNDAVYAQWHDEEAEVDRIIERYALLLVGRTVPPSPGNAEIIQGPWNAIANPVRDPAPHSLVSR